MVRVIWGFVPALVGAGLLLGGVAGIVLQRSHFCTMGCVSDVVLFGSLHRLRIWALALAVALVGSHALHAVGAVDLAASIYRRGGWLWPGILLGAPMFGFGMVLAGGCISRNLVRLGTGSLKAFVALAVAAPAALATAQLLPSRTADWAAAPAGGQPIIAVLLATGLLVFSFGEARFRAARPDWITGALLGLLVPVGWLATASLDARPDSLNYLGRDSLAFTVALAIGTVLGALVSARVRGELRWEAFADTGDLRRHLLGGALMGAGGTLAMGCTIGQGLTGASTVSPGSLVALLGFLAGGWRGIRYLETGRLVPSLPGGSRSAAP